MPSAQQHGADVAGDLRRGAAVGEVDRCARRRAADAAVAHRQDGRHPEVQERSLAERRQIETILAWVAAGSPKGDPKDMPPPKKWADDSGWHLAEKYGAAGSDRQVARLHDAARGAGRLVAADGADRPHRTALGPRDRHPSRRQERPQDHAPRARAPRPAGRHGHRALHQRSRTSPATASSWNGRSARTATRCVRTRAA